jgi:hypothetical protein
MRERYPSGDLDLPLYSLLSYTVSLTDNNACDILSRLLEGYRLDRARLDVIGSFAIELSVIIFNPAFGAAHKSPA